MASQVGSVFGGYHVGGLSELLKDKRRDKKSKKKESDSNGLSSLFSVSHSLQPEFVSVNSVTKSKANSNNPKTNPPEVSLQYRDVDTEEFNPSFKLKQASKRRPKEIGSEDEELSGIPKKKRHLPKKHDSPERLERTIFVGNLSTTVTKKKLKQLFVKYGEVESVRFRSATMANPNLSRKVAMKKKEFHPDKPFVNGYVVFKETSSAHQATESNNEEVDGLHIRVDHVLGDKQHDHKRSIFVGNLSFDLDDEQLREAFSDCGQIESVRIVRDQKTRMGKGFGFVQFRDKDAVSFALKMNKKLLGGRKLRVFPSSENPTDNVKILQKGKPLGYSFSGKQAKKTRHFSDKKRKQNKNMKTAHSLSNKKFHNDKKRTKTKKYKAHENRNAALKRIQSKTNKVPKGSKNDKGKKSKR